MRNRKLFLGAQPKMTLFFLLVGYRGLERLLTVFMVFRMGSLGCFGVLKYSFRLKVFFFKKKLGGGSVQPGVLHKKTTRTFPFCTKSFLALTSGKSNKTCGHGSVSMFGEKSPGKFHSK